MKNSWANFVRGSTLAACALAGATLQIACTGEISDFEPPASGGTNASASGGASPGAGGSGGTGGMDQKPPNQAEDCVGWDVAMPKRLIRLSFNQVAQSLRAIFGDAFADWIQAEHEIALPTERTFPPLGDTREGSSYIDSKWQTADAIADAAGQHVFDQFATVTQCGEAPTTECAQAFVFELAERAFRRPLEPRDRTALLKVYDDSVAAGGSIQESVQYSVYAIFSSPSFLYRTEFGADVAVEGPLSPYELASQLSYFLTDGPPDELLLAAARDGALSAPEQIGAHVDRLLELEETRINLQSAVFASMGIGNVRSVVIDQGKVPEFTGGVANSMYREAELFINDTLWNGTVPELLSSRTSFVNASLADLYGVEPPSLGVDADGFGLVQLPEHRSGLLTMLGFLTSRSRPDEQSVVGRGLAVNDAILCQQNPAFPENIADQIQSLNAELEAQELTERQKADYRATNALCAGCHTSFDPYGVALENFDIIGRYREQDDHGRPIDPAVTLPETAGGAEAQNAAEVGATLAQTGAFSACVATKLLTYALAETGVSGNSCATKAVADAFDGSDQSFRALVRAVAISKTLSHRSGG